MSGSVAACREGSDDCTQGLRGFTIVELMVAVALVSILSGLAIYYLGEQGPQARLRSSTRKLVGLLQYTRSQAAANFTAEQLVLNSAAVTDQIFREHRLFDFDANASNNLAPNGISFGTGAATKDATDAGNAFPPSFDGISIVGNTVRFTPQGTSNSWGYIYLQNRENGTMAVGVRSTGLIVVRTWDGNAGDWK